MPSEAKASVRSMFDAVAPRYDLLNRLLSVGIDKRWRELAVDSLDLSSGSHVLDLCTGTGDLALAASARGASVIGLDLAREMLTHGRDKVKGRPIQFIHGDAESLPVATSSMDAACVGFGIRNVEAKDNAFVEVVRILRPGGRFAVLEFTTPPSAPVRKLYHAYFHHVLPRVGRWVSGHPTAYSYLPQSVTAFSSPQDLAGLLKDSGFSRVTYRLLTAGIACLHLAVK